MVAANDGREPDYFTGRVYGYIDRRDPNTALTVTRLRAFFRLSTLFHLYRIAVIPGTLYRILLNLLRYGLLHWGFFPLFEYDILFRVYLDLMVVFLGLLFLNFWPLNSWGHVCRVIVGFLIQTAVRSYFHGQKEIMDLIFQLHPAVWVSADVVWNILYQHTALPVPNASTMWYIAGLDINPYYLFVRLYVPLSRAYTRWSYCGNFEKEVQSLCFLTPEADFPYLLQGLQEPLTTTLIVTKQPTVTDYHKTFYSVPYPTIVIGTDTKTIFQGPITGEPILPEYITERTSSMTLVTALIAQIAQTITKTLNGRSSEVPLPDSTCPWTYTGTCTTPSPQPYGQ
jgi:hypothetical protein